MKKATPTPARPKRKRRSVRDPDHSMSWRQRREQEGWTFVQFWTRPVIATKLQKLIDQGNAIAPVTAKRTKPKDIIEDLILSAPL